MKEVDWRLNTILDRKNLELEFNALIHDKQMNRKVNTESIPIETSKEQEDAIKRAHEEAVLRKRIG